jgi:hypothetical protein
MAFRPLSSAAGGQCRGGGRQQLGGNGEGVDHARGARHPRGAGALPGPKRVNSKRDFERARAHRNHHTNPIYRGKR